MSSLRKKLCYYFGSTFAYGFYRGSSFTERLTLDNDVSNDNIYLSERFGNGILVGCCYINPILQPIFLSNLLLRIKTKIGSNNINKSYYRDINTYNYNTL